MTQGELFPTKKISGLKGPIAQKALESLRAGRTSKQALADVLEAFPEAKTSIKCIYWYASKAGIRLQGKAQEPVKLTEEEFLQNFDEENERAIA